MKIANYSKTDGKLLGWYSPEINGIYVPEVPAVLDMDGNVKTKAIPAYYDTSSIPKPNIEVSEEEWQIALDNAYNYVDATTGILSFKDFRTETEVLEQQVQVINNAIQNHLDTKAQEFRYDNMMSARSYAGYANPFQTEAQALATWCADCWAKAGQIENDVEAGNRPMPTVDEVLSELPVYGA